ncbi:MAG: hypothetical protein AB8B64_22665 [Granulosicoccus sp.]
MQPKAFGLVAVSLFDALLVVELVRGLQVIESVALWGMLHLFLCIIGAVLLAQLLVNRSNCVLSGEQTDTEAIGSGYGLSTGELTTKRSLQFFVALVSVSMPGVGLAGISLVLFFGLRASQMRTYTPDFWQATPVATLPYVAPLDRQIQLVDSRGFTEHLLYSTDDNDIYHKVLASANVRTSLAVDTLKQAMQHRDEKVRLTAYKTLDRKVTTLNKEIQRLEKELATTEDRSTSDRWLQIASNYWELVTLEGAEVVARKQLLSKAASAAIKAVAQLPGNRNAHLVLGRISLAQGDTRRAYVALERAQALGMPGDKVLPYLAECAYLDKDMSRVQRLLAGLDPSIVAYPPLSHVARYWA